MRIHVLGSAAGGGYPQWNCNCRMCDGVRTGNINAKPRTQSSIAVTQNDKDWILFNVSPDIRTQLCNSPVMQPSRDIRDTGVAAIVLVDSQIDHTAGLLTLREDKPLQIYCTDMVHQDLTEGFPAFKILDHYCSVNVNRIPIGDDAVFNIVGFDGIEIKAIDLNSKAPPYSPHRNDPHPGDNVGISLTDHHTGKSLFYAPGLGEVDKKVLDAMQQADCLLVDGTFWTNNEMQNVGVSSKLARDIGHIPQSGVGGMIEILRPLKRPRKILIHINNTNPILDEDSQERAHLHEEGIEVAFDGMDILL